MDARGRAHGERGRTYIYLLYAVNDTIQNLDSGNLRGRGVLALEGAEALTNSPYARGRV